MSRKSLLPPPPPPSNYSVVHDTGSFQALSSSLKELNSHIRGLKALHDNFTQFNESIGSLIYGMNINAWCTEFKEAPSDENFVNKYKMDSLNMKILQVREKIQNIENPGPSHPDYSDFQNDSTDLTLMSEGSFLENPRSSSSTSSIPVSAPSSSSSSSLIPKQPNFKRPPVEHMSKITKDSNRRQSRIPKLSHTPSLGYRTNKAALLRQQNAKSKQKK